MRKYELVVIWHGDAEPEVFTYDSEDEAEQAGANLKYVFGRQLEWYGTRPKREERR